MAVDKSYTRLGLFLAITVIVVLATAVFFIERLKSRPAIGMVTYTTDNVFGLDVSSAVRLRGVPVGRVTDIRVNPQGSIVEIDFEVYLDRLNTIGVDVKRLRRITDLAGVAPRLRAEVMGNPLTGEAYLLLNQPENPPEPMTLDFKPNRTYVPSIHSPLSLVQDQLPAVLDQANATLQTLRATVAQIPDSIERTDQFLTDVEHTMHESQLPELTADSRQFFATTTAQIEQIRSEMDEVIGTEGTLTRFSEEARAEIKAADLPAATQSLREAADDSRLASDDLRRSLPVIRDSLEQLQALSRTLEDQPESVVYGPRPPEGKRK